MAAMHLRMKRGTSTVFFQCNDDEVLGEAKKRFAKVAGVGAEVSSGDRPQRGHRGCCSFPTCVLLALSPRATSNVILC
jgi:hypothetical protein